MSSIGTLEGIWQATSAIVSGDAISAEPVRTIRLTLTADPLTTARGAETRCDSSYTVNTQKSPSEIEMIGIADFAGQPALGIYALTGETLQLCYRMPGFSRPTDFESAKGSGAFLITLKRTPSP